MTFLFVYGTLRPGSGHPMARYLATRADRHVPATLTADLYDLGWYPGVLVPGRGTVVGDLFTLHPDTATDVLADLDRYEGCAAEDPLPHQYARQRLPVRLSSGDVVDAWVYVLQRLPARAVRIPHGDDLAWRSRDEV